MLHLYLFATAIFLLTALLNFLAACLYHSLGFAAQDFMFLIIHLSNAKLNSMFIFYPLHGLTLELSFFVFTPTIDYTILDWTLEIGSFANRPYSRFLEKSNKILGIKIGTSNKKQTLQSDVKIMFMSNKNKLDNIRHRWVTIIKS